MVFTRKKIQQNEKLRNQLSKSDPDFMKRQSNHIVQIRSRINMAETLLSLHNTIDPIQILYPQVDMHTLEQNIASEVRSEIDSVMTPVETWIQHAVLTAKVSLLILRVPLAMKLANASSARRLDCNFLEPDHRDFSGSIEGLQMTASIKINSHSD